MSRIVLVWFSLALAFGQTSNPLTPPIEIPGQTGQIIHPSILSLPRGGCAAFKVQFTLSPSGFAYTYVVTAQPPFILESTPLIVTGSVNTQEIGGLACHDPSFGAGLVPFTLVGRTAFGQTCEQANSKITILITSQTNDQAANPGTGADPVSTLTGELYDSSPQVDLLLGGPLPLEFARYYAAYQNMNGIQGALGNNWTHNFDVSARVVGPFAGVTLFGGRTLWFQNLGGAWRLHTREKYAFQFVSVSGGGYQLLDPAESLIYSFNSTGRLIRIEDRNGNALSVTLSQTAQGPERVADNFGRTLSFFYSAGGKLTRVQDQSGRSVSFAHTGDDLMSSTDANGKMTRYTYSATGAIQGLQASITLPAGNKRLENEYDAQGRLSRQRDSLGSTSRLEYDQGAGATTTVVTDPRANTTRHQHIAFNNLAMLTDASGAAAEFTYTQNNQLSTFKNRLGDVTTITYTPAGFPATIRDALGNTTQFTYASQTQGPLIHNVLSEIRRADGSRELFTYDPSGNLLTARDRAGRETRYSYNRAGQTLTRTNPAGGVTTWTYNADATVASVRTNSGDTYTFRYDTAKRLVEVRNPDNSTRTVAWDALDNPVRSTDELGRVTALASNDNNYPATATDALNNRTAFAYDSEDRPLTVTNPLGRTVARYAYDPNGNLVSVTDALGQVERVDRDSLDRVTASTDAAGKITRFTYDKEGGPLTVTDPLARLTSFTNDKLGRVTQVTTPLRENWTTVYDAVGRVTRSTNPLNESTEFAYDTAGLLSKITRPGGEASFARNELDLINAVTDPNRNRWSRVYDRQGRATSSTDPLGRTFNYQYDSLSRLSGVSGPDGATAAFTYDAAGNLTRARFNDGLELAYRYDANNRIVEGDGLALAYDAAGRMTASNGLAIGYDNADRIASITYAEGKTVSYTRDARGLVTGVTDWAGATTTIAYNDAGQVVSIRRPNGIAAESGYDGNGSLNALTERGRAVLSSISLRRDAAGRVASATRSAPVPVEESPGVLPLAFDAAHQVSGWTYDGIGRLTADPLRQYRWDQASRLASYAGADGSASFTYDALGMRISRTAAGVTENHVLNYAAELPVVAVVRSGGGDVRYYVHLPGGLLLYSIEARDSSRRFFHFDETGSTIFLTDDSGDVTDAYAYGAYGESAGRTGQTENPFTWLGGLGVMQEGGTSLYYMRHRYYDSASARFLSKDPVESLDPRAVNPYQYALGNPVVYVDPMGLDARIAGNSADFVYSTIRPIIFPDLVESRDLYPRTSILFSVPLRKV